jgi:hypothetical protein
VITLFGAKVRPRTARGRRPARLEVAIETPAYDLTKFKVHYQALRLEMMALFADIGIACG